MSYFPEFARRATSVKTSPALRRLPRMSHLPALLVIALFVTAAGAPARAADAPAPDDKTAQARAASQEANALYAVGEFEQAAEKYQSAYKLKPDPALLYNAAQSYRMAGNNEKALLLYKNYTMFYPTAKNLHNAETQVTKLQEAIAAQHKAQTAPPTTTEPTGGSSTGVAPGTSPLGWPATGGIASGAAVTPPSANGGTSSATLPTAPAPATSSTLPGATLTETAPPATTEGTPVYKKWWFWTAVGAVAAGGVVAILLSSRSSSSWNTAPDFGPGAK